MQPQTKHYHEKQTLILLFSNTHNV
ncbi:hypothetical protein JOD18_003467 [Gracilibacillus alcaliphilus]|nr:hypothetical protein [Gracilibacillus alcaliphilus]